MNARRWFARRLDDLKSAILKYKRNRACIELILQRLHYYGFAEGQCPWPLRPAFKAAFVCAQVGRSPLARGHRIRALARWSAWQAWRRLVRYPVEIQLPGGAWLECPPESRIAGLILATGSHEPAEQEFTGRVVGPGDLAIDVGANIGIFTLALASRGARVAAIEPSVSSRDTLQRSIARNRLGAFVHVYPIALAESSGTRRFTEGLDVTNHLLDDNSKESNSTWVDVQTLDALLASDPAFFNQPVTLVKIDAEGADLRILCGGRNLLCRDRPVVVVETWDGGRSIQRFLDDLDLGYRARRYNFDRTLLEAIPPTFTGQMNVVYVPEDLLEHTERKLDSALSQLGNTLPRVQWTHGIARRS